MVGIYEGKGEGTVSLFLCHWVLSRGGGKHTRISPCKAVMLAVMAVIESVHS